MTIARDLRMILCRYISLTLILFFLSVIQSFAAAPLLRFDRFGVQNGLSDNTITSICQDSRGFMWFGTTNGLNRFDAYNYVHFKHDPNDSTTISDSFIRALYEDSDGVLWVGTINGLNRFSRETGTFVRYDLDPGQTGINSITEGKDGKLWVGTNLGVNSLDRNTGTFKHYFNDSSDSLTISSNNAGSVLTDKNGDIWIGTFAGLNMISHKTGSVKRLLDRNPGTTMPNQNIMDIAEDDNGILWMSTWGGGLRKYNTKTGIYKVFLHDPNDFTSISSNEIGHISVDNNGVLWFGTTRGLNSIDTASDFITRYNHDPTDPFSMSNDSIYGVYNDASGILWVGTLYGGGNKMVPSKSVFRVYNIDEINKHSTTDLQYVGFLESKSSFWLTADSGVFRFNTETEQFSPHVFTDSKDEDIKRSQLITSFSDRSNQLWLATTSAGLVRFDIETGTFTSFDHSVLRSPDASVTLTAIDKDSDGNFWIGTVQGIMKFNPQTESYEKLDVDESKNEILYNTTHIVADSDDKSVWAAGNYGLAQYDRNSKELRFIFSNNKDSRSLSSNFINSLLDDGQGSLWLGTQDGLYSYSKETKIPERHTLSNDTVFDLLLDNNGNVWASTNAGFSCINLESRDVHNYDRGDGMPSSLNMNQSMYCGKDGTIFVGGQNGFFTFHPASFLTNNIPPPVVITSFKVDNVEAQLDKNITDLPELKLPYSKAPLSFEFSALDYANPANNLYAYKVDGLNDDWIQSGNERKVIYTNLKPGSYVFRVKAANSQGVWNNEGAAVRIVITPPFWQRWWFRLSAMFMMVGTILVVHYLSVLVIKRQRAHLEQVVESQTKSLQAANKAKSEFLANMSHELRTPLTAVIGFSEVLNLKTFGELNENQSQYVTDIHESGTHLLSLINDILDLTKIESGKSELELSNTKISGLIESSLIMIKEKCHNHGISLDLNISTDISALVLAIDERKIKQVLYNLLSNAAKFTPDGGSISVQAEKKDSILQVSVTDSGIGISSENLGKIFDEFYQVQSDVTDKTPGTGLGLPLSRRIIEAHKGELRAESQGNGKGSCFTFNIPI